MERTRERIGRHERNAIRWTAEYYDRELVKAQSAARVASVYRGKHRGWQWGG